MNRYFRYLVILFFCLAIFLGADILRQKPDENSLSINFLDVGQGDAALIQKGDYQILIDGGPDDKVLSEVGKLMSPLDRKIELVILSHPHADHIVGVNNIIERYEIGEILSTGVIFSSAEYLKFLDLVKQKQIALNVPSIGSRRIFSDAGAITFLWPGDRYMSQTIDNLNDSSLVAKVCYFEKCSLFLGDIEKEEQETILDYYKNIKAEEIFTSEIVKVSHHGSSNGLLPALQEIINAKYAVISAGKDNQFGHPHQSVLDYFDNKKIPIFRTDQNGTIKVKITSDNIEIK